MTDNRLKGLSITARVLFTDDFLEGVSTPDFDEHVVDLRLDRVVDLRPLDALIAHVVGSTGSAREASDSWLAPRLHAALRVRRAEAADRRLWSYLAVVRYPAYVRWRFPGRDGGSTAVKRFVGADRDNALSRLWWGAELTRNGGDYAPTVRAFERQDVPNTWFALDAFHNRALAQAAVRMLPGLDSKAINRLSTAFNHYLTTIMLDSVAPVPSLDFHALQEWLQGAADPDDLLGPSLPEGPQEDPVDEQQIAAAAELVRSVAEEIGIAVADRVS